MRAALRWPVESVAATATAYWPPKSGTKEASRRVASSKRARLPAGSSWNHHWKSRCWLALQESSLSASCGLEWRTTKPLTCLREMGSTAGETVGAATPQGVTGIYYC